MSRILLSEYIFHYTGAKSPVLLMTAISLEITASLSVTALSVVLATFRLTIFFLSNYTFFVLLLILFVKISLNTNSNVQVTVCQLFCLKFIPPSMLIYCF